jgi:diacylglycerol kinase (ATP)
VTVVGVLAHSGKTLGGGLGALRTLLAQHGVDDPQWREVPKSKFVPKMVAELIDAGVDLLFVWGGDGSVQKCIDTVGNAPITLAILPAGTSNLFARNLGIPTDLEEAVNIGFSGRRRILDVGTVNGERFGVMAGTGFDALMISAADAGQKDRLGRLAYVWAGLRGVGRDAVQTRVEVDGMAWFKGPATCVLVGNMGTVLGGMAAFPDARPDDGRLDVGIVTAQGVVDWARTLGRTMAGHPGSSPFIETMTATRIDVRLEKKLPYELDGGDRPETKHLRFRVKPAAITVCVPESEETR